MDAGTCPTSPHMQRTPHKSDMHARVHSLQAEPYVYAKKHACKKWDLLISRLQWRHQPNQETETDVNRCVKTHTHICADMGGGGCYYKP